MIKPPKDERDDQEAAKRRDDALRRALKMPPKPHKPAQKGEDRSARKRKGSAEG